MTSEPPIVGIDLGKNWFHLIELDQRGATALRRKVNRQQLAEYAATAIAEAGSRASMRRVPLKTNEQLELQALHHIESASFQSLNCWCA